MVASSLLIRSPLSSDELIEHIAGYVQVAQSFSPDPLPDDTATRLLRRLTTLPGYRQEQVRSVYRDGEQLGGYRIYERQLRVGISRLATGCIGGVYTRAQAFIQVVFGYCPIARVLRQREHPLPSDVATMLTILFPTGQTWIPASDWF